MFMEDYFMSNINKPPIFLHFSQQEDDCWAHCLVYIYVGMSGTYFSGSTEWETDFCPFTAAVEITLDSCSVLYFVNIKISYKTKTVLA